jgi:hypothetical protein
VFTFHIWNSAKWVAPFCVSKIPGRDVGGKIEIYRKHKQRQHFPIIHTIGLILYTTDPL